MTDRDALIAACKAFPDEDTPRLAYLDWLEETGGVTDFTTATREFYAKCRERRRYYPALSGDTRRAMPGWREWLSGDEQDGHILRKFDGSPNYWGKTIVNWVRLVPHLWPRLNRVDIWQRRKGAVLIRHTLERHHIRLIFARGWLARAEFLPRRLEDDFLPAILIDQPFFSHNLTPASQP